ncbi:MAG: DNA-processing protein DprA [Clostridia bacterium]|nr:DNA-processing protein DprA [Clostridia bacterium]
MNKSTLFYIWLTQGIGYCSEKAKYIHNLYPDIEMLYKGGEQELRLCGIFTEREISKLKKTSVSDCEKILNRCIELNFKVYDISMPQYPQRLREIPDAPAVIYVSGELPEFDGFNTISVVGTRRATVYGIRTALSLGANLSKQGFVVVSGGALGIDCAAHRGVLQEKGKAVCVLGCGIDFDYLMENKELRNIIAQTGALVSEYPPGTAAVSHNFPQRNRIISALSDGVIVVEAPKKSGSMITVDYALKQGRDIFAVMGNVDSPYSAGSNQLIKEGAVPITCWQDVAEFYRGVIDYENPKAEMSEETVNLIPSKNKDVKAHSENKPVPVHKDVAGLTEVERKVYLSLSETPMHIDTIAEKCSMEPFAVIRAISSLEIKDLIENTDGRLYAIK